MEGPRACRLSEFDEIVTLINQVFRSGSDQDVRTDYPLIFHPSRMEHMRVVKVDGKIVSHVPVGPRQVIAHDDSFVMGIIGGTVTHPDYRRQGHATLCLRDCVRIMEESDWPVSVLWTIEPTFPFYQNSGWEAVGSQGWMYTLGPQDAALFDAGPYDIAAYNPPDVQKLEAMMRIHEGEPLRIGRSRAEYEVLFNLHKIGTFAAMKGGETIAYLMVGHGTNKPGLIEGGGDPQGLEALAAHVLKGWDCDEELQVLAPLTASALGDLMEARKPRPRRPIEEAKGVGFQMMRVNDFGLLMRSIPGWLARSAKGLRGEVCIVCDETQEAVTLKVRGGVVDVSNERLADPVVLTRRQLTQLCFGSHPALEPLPMAGKHDALLRALFPVYFPIWELDHS